MPDNSVRILVVGGRGFIGRHIVDEATRRGWSVTSLGMTSGHMDIGSGAGVVRYLEADITNPAALGEKLQEAAFEYVVNCGGYIDHTPFLRGGRKVLNAHFIGVTNLVEALDKNALKRFVNIGSSDEYGNTAAPQMESQREAPISPYSLAKAAATHFLQMLARTEGFPATTLRLFLTYGPGQDDKRFLPQIIKGCLEGRQFPTSSGEQMRDFCYIDDTVSAIFAALLNPAASGEVINIGSGEPVSIRAMIESVRRLVGRGEPRFGEIAYRPGENMELYADISSARSILDWEPKISLEAGLTNTIQYIKDRM